MPTPEEVMVARLRGERPSVDELYSKLEQLRQNPVDYAKIQEAGRQRTDAARRDLTAGMALSALGGSAFKAPGYAVLQQSLGGFSPQRLSASEAGYFDPSSGQFVENPLAARQREEKFLTGRIDRRTAEDLRREQMANSAAARAAALSQSGYYKQLAADAAAAKEKRLTAPQVVKGVVSPAGSAVYLDPEAGVYRDPQGNAVNPIPFGAYQKQYSAQEDARNAANLGRQLIADVKSNPGAFGTGSRVAGALPDAMGISAAAQEALLSPAERQTRAGVLKNAYTVIHSLTGAALSQHEEARLRPFVPAPTDTPAVVLDKLQGAITEYDRIQADRMKAGTVLGSPGGPAAPASGDDALIQKYLGGQNAQP